MQRPNPQTVDVEWKMGTGTVGNTNHHCHTGRRRSQSPFSGSRICSLSYYILKSRGHNTDIDKLDHYQSNLAQNGKNLSSDVHFAS